MFEINNVAIGNQQQIINSNIENSEPNRLEINNQLFDQLLTRIFEYIFNNNINNLADRYPYFDDRQEILRYQSIKIYQNYSYQDFSSFDLEQQLHIILNNMS